MLMLKHNARIEPHKNLPRFRGLVVERSASAGEPAQLTIRLLRPEFGDVFRQFCDDTITATKKKKNEREAVDCFLNRAWQWQRFLENDRDGRLKDRRQMGLLGELEVLTEIVAPALGSVAAVEAWTGPRGEPKDFKIGQIGIEVKAAKLKKNKVWISSENQLDAEGLNVLFLVVIPVRQIKEQIFAPLLFPERRPLTRTVTDRVKEIRGQIASEAPEARGEFDGHMKALGYDSAHDYSHNRWELGSRLWFRVSGDFPRIKPKSLSRGVDGVQYWIALAECEKFRIDEEDVRTEIEGTVADQP